MTRLRLKHRCPGCSSMRWIIDFKEGHAKDITRRSVCAFCDLKGQHAKEISGLRKIIKALEGRVKALEGSLPQPSLKSGQGSKELTGMEGGVAEVKRAAGSSSQSRNAQTGMEEGSAEVEHRSETADVCQRAPGAPMTYSEAVKTPPQVKSPPQRAPVMDTSRSMEKKKKQKKKRKTDNEHISNKGEKLMARAGKEGQLSPPIRRPPDPERERKRVPPPVRTQNRFALLSELEDEALLIGDSQVRGQEEYFAAVSQTKRTVRCMPGKGVREIRKELEKVRLATRDSALVAQVSGNDLFLRKGRVGYTEPIIGETLSLVDDMKLKSDRALILGLLPRKFASSLATSKCIGINNRLEKLCALRGVQFLDPFPWFYGMDDLYLQDGVHLSQKGKATLGRLLNKSVYSTMEAHRGRRPPHVKSGPPGN